MDIQVVMQEGYRLWQKYISVASTDLLLFIPTDGMEYITPFTKQLVKKNYAKITILHSDDLDETLFEFSCCSFIKLDEAELNLLIRYLVLMEIQDKIIILSFQTPYPTYAENYIGYKNTTKEELIRFNIFKEN